MNELQEETRRAGFASRGLAVEVRPMLALALPVVISELGWMAMGMVDMVMVGSLGPEAIGAVGLGNILFFDVAIFGYGLLLGLDTLISQSYGAGDLEGCHRSLIQGLYLAISVSIPSMLILEGVAEPILRATGVDPGVLAPAIPYLRIMNWGLAPLMLFSAIRRYLQSMNLVVPIMLSLFVANLANWLGNLVLVRGRFGFPAMGVSGSAWATVGSRVAMLAFGAGYALWHGARRRTGLLQVTLRPDWSGMGRLIRLGLPSAVQLTLELVVFGTAALLAGRLGAEALAAHEVVLLIAGTAFMVPLGISSAAAVRVGQAIGRGDPPGAARSGWTAMAIGAGFMACSGLTMLIVPGPILGLFTDDPGVTRTAHSLLIAAALFQIFDGIQVVGSGALRGLGETKFPMYATLAAHWAIGLPIGYAMAFPARLGVVGLWIGLSTGLIAAGAMMLVAWRRWVRAL